VTVGVDAVLDANVLFPSSLRDTLLRAASANMYRLHWTDDILEEVRRNLIAKRMSDERANRLITQMRRASPDALVTMHQPHVTLMTNDPKDRHVLAAAVVSKSSVVVTCNLRDFPPVALAPFGVEAQPPDDFLTDLLTQDADLMLRLLAEQARDLRRPQKTFSELLDILAQHAPSFVSLVRRSLTP